LRAYGKKVPAEVVFNDGQKRVVLADAVGADLKGDSQEGQAGVLHRFRVLLLEWIAQRHQEMEQLPNTQNTVRNDGR